MRANSTPAMSPPLLTAKEAASILRISPRTLCSMTAPRGEIPVVRIGRSLRYPIADLECWIETQKQQKQGGGDR